MIQQHRMPSPLQRLLGRRWLIVVVALIAVVLGYLTYLFARMPAARHRADGRHDVL